MQHYPEPYLDYLIHFHGTRDYFECHEIMEEHWIETERNIKWLTLIQLAVAVYHERQQNRKGSNRLYRKVLHHISQSPGILDALGLDEKKTIELVEERIQRNLDEQPFENFNLPMIDSNLENACIEKCEKLQIKWLSSELDEDLIFRHRLRDRSDVIEAREQAKLEKEKQRDR